MTPDDLYIEELLDRIKIAVAALEAIAEYHIPEARNDYQAIARAALARLSAGGEEPRLTTLTESAEEEHGYCDCGNCIGLPAAGEGT